MVKKGENQINCIIWTNLWVLFGLNLGFCMDGSLVLCGLNLGFCMTESWVLYSGLRVCMVILMVHGGIRVFLVELGFCMGVNDCMGFRVCVKSSRGCMGCVTSAWEQNLPMKG